MRDLSRLPVVGLLFRSPTLLAVVRVALLVLLVATIAYGWHQHAIPGVSTKDPLMYGNFTNFGFWVLWMMGIAFIALVAGRFWCVVCPAGWVNGLISRFGLNRSLPSWLRGSMPVTLTLVCIQMAVYLWAIHRFPDYTARLLGLFLLLLVGAGLLFRGRALCSLFCPAGALFALYARIVPFALRVANPAVCNGCDSRRCLSRESYWQTLSLPAMQVAVRRTRSDCPVDLPPEGFGSNPTCTLCMNCLQNCDKGNVAIGYDAESVRSPLPLTRGEGWFFLVLLGLLTANFVKTNAPLREALLLPPALANQALGFGDGGYYLLAALWVSLLLPLLMVLPGFIIDALSAARVGSASSPPAPGGIHQRSVGFTQFLSQLGYLFTPLLLAVHLVLALVKLNAKGPYLPYVLADPSGVQSYLAMNVMHTLNQPGVLIPLDILKWLVLLLVLGGIAGSVFLIRRSVSNSLAGFAGRLLPVAIPSAFYVATVIRWLFIR